MGHTLLLRSTPALASCASSAAALSCHLFVKYSADLNQAAIVISLSAHIHGFRDAQDFDLIYNADILVPAGTFLGPAPKDLSPAQLSMVARKSAPSALKTFVLELRTPCSIRCSDLADCIAPKQGHEAPFRQLRDLASATQVSIVFDASFVHKRHYAAFHHLITHPDRLAGIPAQAYQGSLSRQVDWTAFGPVDEAGLEAPPSYEEVREKRRRQSSSPQLPPAKRERVEPEADYWGSPTDKATTTEECESPSPRAPLSPYPNALIEQETTKAALEALLPEALQKAMPGMLAHAFAVPHPATSDSLASGSLGAIISSRIASDVEARLQPLQTKAIRESCTEAVEQMSRDLAAKICAKTQREILRETLDHGYDLRADADYQFFAELDEHKLDVTIAKDEGLEEIRRELEAKRDDLFATADEVIVQSGVKLQGQVDDAWELTKHALLMREDQVLQRVRQVVERQHAKQREQHHHPPSAARPSRVQRAASVPL